MNCNCFPTEYANVAQKAAKHEKRVQMLTEEVVAPEPMKQLHSSKRGERE